MKQVSRIFFLLTVLLVSIPSWAAMRKIQGTVTDPMGDPLIGANVTLEGQSLGTTTDIDGNFSLQVPEGKATLKCTYIGFEPVTIQVAPDQATVEIKMAEDVRMLEETIVVGYGTQKKVNLTGAVASISGDALEDRTAINVSNMLQGSVAGLNVTTSSGLPGSSASINIRGVTSINSADPLVLIDGSIGSIDNVNPNDIQSISVIKDASAAAVYGARAAFGVILVTTKQGSDTSGKATVRYSGRMGWEEPTTSTDYETRGYWSVATVNQFFSADSGNDYVKYTDRDMMELLARVNDKTENPDRPWTVEEVRNGKRQWVYYGNYDWYHTLYKDKHFKQQHNVTISGGNKGAKYFVSGGLNHQDGMMKITPDVYKKYNLRAKIDFDINKYADFSNNTSFFGSTYTYQGDGSAENTLTYSARHALACFPMTNPDGTWLYQTPYTNYKIANGRHIFMGNGSHRNVDRKTDFTNTSRLNIKPFKQLTLTADFTYRFYQTRNTSRSQPIYYRVYPDADLLSYNTGAGLDELSESVKTYQYYSMNAIATFQDTFKDVHNLKVMVGYNYETRRYKGVGAVGQNLSSTDLDDLDLVGANDAGQVLTSVSGGQNEYALQGIFGRINYDYKGKYLLELSGRYDGSSRFAKGNRWGWFPSGSIGWRISEEKFFQPLQPTINNFKIRASYGSLGNQDVSYYTFVRLISMSDFAAYSFGEGSSMAKYSTLAAPIASDLTWETAHQYDLGFDLGFLNNRLSATVDLYIRDTKGMLTNGIDLPAVFGASTPKMNTADLRTKGYELSLNWNDRFELFGKTFTYGVGFNLSDYQSTITKYLNNDNKSLSESYYEGMRLGEIWGFETDGLFPTTEAAQSYANEVDLSYVAKRITGGWQAGDLKYVDSNGDGIISLGANTVDNPGDRKVLGNSLPSLSYGIRANFSYCGFDVNAFFQGTGNHYWYPTGMSMPFWGCYSYPYLSFIQSDFREKVWSEDNPNAYFPRPMAYAATSGTLSFVNDRYIQNLRYLRLKNLTVGYTVPQKWTKKAGLNKVRFYFSGENLCYWSPLKKNSKYIDPEAAFNRSSDYNNMFYPWAKSIMFGLDLSF